MAEPVQKHASESAIRASKDAERALLRAVAADYRERTVATRDAVWRAWVAAIKAAERE